jgi:hypothetical protein
LNHYPLFIKFSFLLDDLLHLYDRGFSTGDPMTLSPTEFPTETPTETPSFVPTATPNSVALAYEISFEVKQVRPFSLFYFRFSLLILPIPCFCCPLGY